MSLIDKINLVKEFHEVFKTGNNESPTVALSKEEIKLRFKLMQEENEEYLEAAEKGDLVEVADALGDMMYILFGTILRHGLQYKIDEIQRSNMSKLDADGNPIFREDGKILKGENYFRPNIRKVLEQ